MENKQIIKELKNMYDKYNISTIDRDKLNNLIMGMVINVSSKQLNDILSIK